MDSAPLNETLIEKSYVDVQQNTLEPMDFGEWTATNPSLVHAESLFYRIREVWRARREDIQDSEHPMATRALGWSVYATQALDRLHYSFVLVPLAGEAALDATNKSVGLGMLATGLAVGGAIFVSNAPVGATLVEGWAKHPKTAKAVEKNFPEILEMVEEGTPTVEANSNAAKKLGKHASRGLVGLGLGATMHVGAAGIRGAERKQNHKLNFGVLADMSLWGVAIGALVAGVVTKSIENGDFETAKDIQDIAGNSYLWLGVAGVFVAAELLAKRLHPIEKLKKLSSKIMASIKGRELAEPASE